MEFIFLILKFQRMEKNEKLESIDELHLSLFHSPFLSLGVFEMHPEIFEKDDDSNGHIDFITAASVRSISFDTTSTASLCHVVQPSIA